MKHRFTSIMIGTAAIFGTLFVAPSASASAPAASTVAMANTPAGATRFPVATPNTASGCSASGTPGNFSITYTANRYCTSTAIRAWVTCEYSTATHYGSWAYAYGTSKASCTFPYDGGVYAYGYDYSN